MSRTKLIDAVWEAMADKNDPLDADDIRDAIEQAIDEYEDAQ